MIIDSHAHLWAPPGLAHYRSWLFDTKGAEGRGSHGVSEDELGEWADENVVIQDVVGTGLQLLSPRPFQLAHSQEPAQSGRWWVEASNDLIEATVRRHPNRFRGICGLPQHKDAPVEIALEELERCVEELGFVGALVNPDPSEGAGTTPTMDSEYWYPLWEKLEALDVPAFIHPSWCNGRESYDEHFISEESLAVLALCRSRVFEDFPALRIHVSHGGGSVPYQIGRWRSKYLNAATTNQKSGTDDLRKRLVAPREGWPAATGKLADDDFLYRFRRMWYDTCIWAKDPLELLFKVAGPDRCVFGTERPGSGGGFDPVIGRPLDDLAPTIEEIDFLSPEDRQGIFEGNARALYTRLGESKPAAAGSGS